MVWATMLALRFRAKPIALEQDICRLCGRDQLRGSFGLRRVFACSSQNLGDADRPPGDVGPAQRA